MKTMYWFRWYRGTVEDGKLRIIARASKVNLCEVIAVWALLLEDATHETHRGVCTRDEQAIGAILDLKDETVERVLEAMEANQMIQVGRPVGYAGGAHPLAVLGNDITILNWDKRQFESDISDPTATERKRRQRSRERHGDGTPVSRQDRDSGTDVTRDSHGARPESVRPETETESEVDKTPPPSPASTLENPSTVEDLVERCAPQPVHRSPATSSDLDFEAFWAVWPNRVGRKPAEASFTRIRKAAKVAQATIIAGVHQYIAHKPTDRQWMLPATFLNQERWNDQPAPPVAKPHSAGAPVPYRAPVERVVRQVDFSGGILQEKQVIVALRRFKYDQSWPAEYGPEPFEPGCKVPKQWIENSGIRESPLVRMSRQQVLINHGNGVVKDFATGETVASPVVRQNGVGATHVANGDKTHPEPSQGDCEDVPPMSHPTEEK